MKIYTRTGDQGQTSLRWGERVPKDAQRVEAYGAIDEANAFVGLALAHLAPLAPLAPAAAGGAAAGQGTGPGAPVDAGAAPGDPAAVLSRVQAVFTRVQRELFDVGADLATPPDRQQGQQPKVRAEHVSQLEQDIDALEAGLPPLRHFILPGGAVPAAALHAARTVARRAERRLVTLARLDPEHLDAVLVQYVNRLSDLLFVAARAVNHALQVDEPKVVFGQ